MSGPLEPSVGWAVNANAEPSGAYAAWCRLAVAGTPTVSAAWLGVGVGSSDGGAGVSLTGGDDVTVGSSDAGTTVFDGLAGRRLLRCRSASAGLDGGASVGPVPRAARRPRTAADRLAVAEDDERLAIRSEDRLAGERPECFLSRPPCQGGAVFGRRRADLVDPALGDRVRAVLVAGQVGDVLGVDRDRAGAATRVGVGEATATSLVASGVAVTSRFGNHWEEDRVPTAIATTSAPARRVYGLTVDARERRRGW